MNFIYGILDLWWNLISMVNTAYIEASFGANIIMKKNLN